MLGACWRGVAWRAVPDTPAASLLGLPNIVLFRSTELALFLASHTCCSAKSPPQKSNTNIPEEAWLWSRMDSFLGPPRCVCAVFSPSLRPPLWKGNTWAPSKNITDREYPGEEPSTGSKAFYLWWSWVKWNGNHSTGRLYPGKYARRYQLSLSLKSW